MRTAPAQLSLSLAHEPVQIASGAPAGLTTAPPRVIRRAAAAVLRLAQLSFAFMSRPLQIVFAGAPAGTYRKKNWLPKEQRRQRHEAVVGLHRQGLRAFEIGRVVGLDRRSVDYILDRPSKRRSG